MARWWRAWHWLADTLDLVDELIAGLHSPYPNHQHDLAIKARTWVHFHDIRRRRHPK
jgi:hypothetical protein